MYTVGVSNNNQKQQNMKYHETDTITQTTDRMAKFVQNGQNVVAGDYAGSDLTGAPEIVEGSFELAQKGGLKSLVGGPEFVGFSYMAWNVGLESLAGAPKALGGPLDVSHNTKLKSFAGLEETKFGPIGNTGAIYAYDTGIETFCGLPEDFKGSVDVSNTPLAEKLNGLGVDTSEPVRIYELKQQLSMHQYVELFSPLEDIATLGGY